MPRGGGARMRVGPQDRRGPLQLASGCAFRLATNSSDILRLPAPIPSLNTEYWTVWNAGVLEAALTKELVAPKATSMVWARIVPRSAGAGPEL